MSKHGVVVVGVLGLAAQLGCLAPTRDDAANLDEDKAGVTEANEDSYDWADDPGLRMMMLQAEAIGTKYDLCDETANYDGICLDWCWNDLDCGAAQTQAVQNRSTQRLPIVLVHGFNAGKKAFHDVAPRLRDAGFIVEEVQLSPYAPTVIRTDELATQIAEIKARHGAAKVHLIAHSFGGIDARRLVHVPPFTDVAASITTVSTPHRGTHIAELLTAEWVLELAPAVLRRISFIGESDADFVEQNDFAAQVADMMPAAMEAFNAAYPDRAGVFYQSYAGYATTLGVRNSNHLGDCEEQYWGGDAAYDHINPLLAVSHVLLRGADDGLVAVRSAKWGRFRGCLPGDHLDVIGQIQKSGANSAGFAHHDFYLQVAQELVTCEAAASRRAFNAAIFAECMQNAGAPVN
ncbi:MAG: alpha/beta fold hydrolase [Myxococcales bacterium]|nr:alpha/beta fold hydrolase [Myxococcales bacterium]